MAAQAWRTDGDAAEPNARVTSEERSRPKLRGPSSARANSGKTSSPTPGRNWRLPFWVFLVGAFTSLAVYFVTISHERAERRRDFDRRAAQVARAAQASFDVPLEVLRSIPALFDASTEVTRTEFRAFVQSSLSRYPWIYALEWIPRVPGDQRARFEAAAIRDGLTRYHFKQDAPNGPPVPADERPEYFPLFYMEPPNPVALGIEETALGARKVALERARDLNTTVITEQLKLVQDAVTVKSVIAFHPVYRPGSKPSSPVARRQALIGYAAAVFRVEPVVRAALRDIDLDLLDVVLIDTEPESQNVLFQSRPGAASTELDKTRAVWEDVATIGARRWAFRVIDRANWVHAPRSGWMTLLMGLLTSLLADGQNFRPALLNDDK